MWNSKRADEIMESDDQVKNFRERKLRAELKNEAIVPVITKGANENNKEGMNSARARKLALDMTEQLSGHYSSFYRFSDPVIEVDLSYWICEHIGIDKDKNYEVFRCLCDWIHTLVDRLNHSSQRAEFMDQVRVMIAIFCSFPEVVNCFEKP